jgi:hypothetical protein
LSDPTEEAPRWSYNIETTAIYDHTSNAFAERKDVLASGGNAGCNFMLHATNDSATSALRSAPALSVAHDRLSRRELNVEYQLVSFATCGSLLVCWFCQSYVLLLRAVPPAPVAT